jgi:hypothetical protein
MLTQIAEPFVEKFDSERAPIDTMIACRPDLSE